MWLKVTADAFQSTTSGSDFYFIVLTDDAKEMLYGVPGRQFQSKTHVDGGHQPFWTKGDRLPCGVLGVCLGKPGHATDSDFSHHAPSMEQDQQQFGIATMQLSNSTYLPCAPA